MSQPNAADALVLKRTVGHSGGPNNTGYGSNCAVGLDESGDTVVYAGAPWYWERDGAYAASRGPTGGVWCLDTFYLPGYLSSTSPPLLQGTPPAGVLEYAADAYTGFGTAIAALPTRRDMPVAISAPTATAVFDPSNVITPNRYSIGGGSSSPRVTGAVVLVDHATLRDANPLPDYASKLENGTLKHTVIDHESHCMNLRDGWVAPDPDSTSMYTGHAFSAKLRAEEAQLASEAPSMNGSFGEVLFMCESASSNNRLLLVGAPRADAPAVWVVERGTVHEALGYFTANTTAKAEYFRTSEEADARAAVLNGARQQGLVDAEASAAARLAAAIAFLEAATGLPPEIWFLDGDGLGNVAVSKAMFIAMLKGEDAVNEVAANDPLAFTPMVAEMARRQEEVDQAEHEWERMTSLHIWHADRWSSLYTVLVEIYDKYPQAQDEEEALQLAAADGYEAAASFIPVRAELQAAWDRLQFLRSKLAEDTPGMEEQLQKEQDQVQLQAPAGISTTMLVALSNSMDATQKLALSVWWPGLLTGGVTAEQLRADPSIGLGTKLWEACGLEEPGAVPTSLTFGL